MLQTRLDHVWPVQPSLMDRRTGSTNAADAARVVVPGRALAAYSAHRDAAASASRLPRASRSCPSSTRADHAHQGWQYVVARSVERRAVSHVPGLVSNPQITMDEARQRGAVSVEDAAHLLGIGRQTAYAAARDGTLHTVRIGRRLIVPVSALVELLEAGPHSG